MMRAHPPLIAFLRFGGLSGLGWIADTCILLSLVELLGLAPFAANLISSGVAALSVFLLSRETVFNKAAGRVGLRVVGYLAYTFFLICVASLGVQAISTWVGKLAAAGHAALSGTEAAAVAKVLVTPPQLVLNFLVSRFLSERDMEARSAGHG